MDALRPAIRFAVSVFAERAPPVMLPILVRWDTIQYIFLTFLEGYHLRHHSASFSEHFFGLRREESAPKRKLTPIEAVELQRRRQAAPELTVRQQIVSLVAVAVLPWIQGASEMRFREVERLPHGQRTMWQRHLVTLHPWVYAAGDLLALGYRLLYLLGRTNTWSPVLHVLGLQLVRHFPEPPGQLAVPGGLRRRLWAGVTNAGSSSLWGAVYLMQFAQWWLQREHLLQPYQSQKVPPPPPVRPPYGDVMLPAPPQGESALGTREDGPRLVLLPQDRTVCPLCHRVRRNPAMSCSGYIFCYPCLVPHVQRYGHCPVTGAAMTSEQIRRIRDDSDNSFGS